MVDGTADPDDTLSAKLIIGLENGSLIGSPSESSLSSDILCNPNVLRVVAAIPSAVESHHVDQSYWPIATLLYSWMWS